MPRHTPPTIVLGLGLLAAAKSLGLPRAEISAALLRGEITAYQFGKSHNRIRIPASDLERWMRSWPRYVPQKRK